MSTTVAMPRQLLAEGQVRAAHLVIAEELQLIDRRQPDPDVGPS